ncbi:MAG: MarR family transcriptional regulator [Pseudomonadota bacterium]
MINEQEALRTWLDLLSKTNALKKVVDNALRAEHGVSISRFDVLAALHRAGEDGLRAGALTQRLKVTDGNTTQVTARLIEDGFVKRRKDPKDGRVAIYVITKKGARLFNDMANTNKMSVVDAFGALSDPQMRSMRNLLQKIDVSRVSSMYEKDVA